MSDTSDYKLMARRLRGELAEAGLPVNHSQALEFVAHLHGARDWNTLAASASDVSKPVRTPAAANDAPAAVSVQVHEVVPFLHPSSMVAAPAFYRGVLGLRIALCWPSSDDIRWCRLELGNAAIMLEEETRRHSAPARAAGRLGEGLSLTFTCSNALAVYDTATAAACRPRSPLSRTTCGSWSSTIRPAAVSSSSRTLSTPRKRPCPRSVRRPRRPSTRRQVSARCRNPAIEVRGRSPALGSTREMK